MDFTFVKGEAYWGTTTYDNSQKKIFVVTARRGRRVSFAHVNDVRREIAEDCGGTEIARIRDADGHDYILSSRATVDIDEALEIAAACR